MTRASAFKLLLAALLVGIAAWLWVRRAPGDLDIAAADAVAKATAVRYAAATGEPIVHFGTARRFAWPDGWEFVWRYRPCPADAALRIFVPLSGRGIRITERPDCTPRRGDPRRA